MQRLTLNGFKQLLDQAPIKPRLKRELRFVSSTVGMEDKDWEQTELLTITDRSGTKGILLLVPGLQIFVLPYSLMRGLTDKRTGRGQPIICDFCRTWQAGSTAGSITFHRSGQDSVSFLCCADLACSKHVRGLTQASCRARAQIRENLTDEQRIERLKSRLRAFVVDQGLLPTEPY